MPFSRFTKLIIKYILSKNDQIYKISLSFHHVIKLDATLGNMKFENKGTKDLVFGMPIQELMLNNEIKTLMIKHIIWQSLKDLNLSKLQAETVIEEVAQSKEVAKDVNSEENDEELLVRRRPTGVVIGGEVRSESDDEGVDHS
ncbi:hypothetical protein Tco_0877498 [Tanacetum coccineum]|uniref:Uncharacterized protein n=1 Tax=Tanacetum coccineum TaxID=301880 RepID=A0ABQ5BYB6_9ASTR